MHGVRRVIVFCTLTTVLPTMLLVIPLYLRHSFYANVVYAVTESDILEVTDGVSTVFCSEHILQMNATFNAFQMTQRPEITSYRKHIRLKKSMNLPDDTLEYWGFYLLKGATVALSVCSRFQGASILVVKGERNLRTCGMLEHNYHKQVTQGIYIPGANRQVKITFESNAQEINSEEYKFNEPSSHTTESTTNSEIPGEQKVPTAETHKNVKHVIGTAADEPSLKNDTLEALFQTAETYVQKHIETRQKHGSQRNDTRRIRHAKNGRHKLRSGKRHDHSIISAHTAGPLSRQRRNINESHANLVEKLKFELNVIDVSGEAPQASLEVEEFTMKNRKKRSQELAKPPSLLDRGILHGGNAAKNYSSPEDASSVSSFENGLFNCYGGSILLAEEFAPSDQCVNVSYLLTGKHMETRHHVAENGYYYYIFYSDNDIVSNDIHALFDIYKPTFQYENVTKSCVNQTECSFSLSLLSTDRVVVEIPTRNGIEHEVDDTSLLVSICRPRMGIYMIFPIAVLFFVISCAFM